MGTTATFVAARERSAEGGERSPLEHGWWLWEASDVIFPPDELAPSTVPSGSALAATVLDSDYCEVVGVERGKTSWRWAFGELPVPVGTPGKFRISSPQATAASMRGWAERAGLAPPPLDAVVDLLNSGYVFAEEVFFGLLDVLDLRHKFPDVVASAVTATPDERRARALEEMYATRHRWWNLRVETAIDLYEVLPELAGWLTDARSSLLAPLMATFDIAALRLSIGPHESRQGPPGGAIVTTSGWTTKNRPVFGSGDDAGWRHKMRQLTSGDLREVEIHLVGLGADGRTFRGPGEMAIGAVIRHQFSTMVAAPLPAHHPAVLYANVQHELGDRVASSELSASLVTLAMDAAQRFDASSAFVEAARPVSPTREADLSLAPTLWSLQ